MSGPTVSVVIPVYDTEDYLPACLDSVLGQTFSDIEVVCVDDGSSDGSPRILKERAAADERLVVLENPDGSRGPGAARNLGIERARGDYLAFVDSDDLLAPTMLEELVSASRAGDADIAMCMVEKFNEDEEQSFAPCRYGSTIPRALDDRTFTWRDLGADVFQLRFTACNKVYTRDLLERQAIRFAEDRFYEDLTFTYQALLTASSLRFVRKGLYLNRRHRPGATTFTQGSRVFDAFDAMADLETFLRSDDAYTPLLESFEAFRFGRLRKYVYKNDPEHLPRFYDRLQQIAEQQGLEGNSYLSDKDREVLARVRARSTLEFLTDELWEVRNSYSGAKRRITSLDDRNRRLAEENRRLREVSGLSVGRIVHGVRWRMARLLRRLRSQRRGGGASGPTGSGGQPAVTAGGVGKGGAGARKASTAVTGGKDAAGKKGPFQGYPRDSSTNIHDAVDFLRMREVRNLHAATEQRIRERLAASSAPLRLGLVVNEAAKWNASSLVRAIEAEPRIDARVLLTWYPVKGQLPEERLERYEEQRASLERYGLPVVELYDRKTGLGKPIEDEDDDVLLLQQPWGMKDFPRRLTGRALPAYLHYGFMIMANHGMHYNIGSFHPYLWRYFAQTEAHRQLHVQHDPAAADQIVVTGYPKLDVYLDDPPAVLPSAWQDRSAPGEPDMRVIFAPHHALGKDNLGMSTFGWSHEVMLRIARDHPRIQWLYKPHPNLRYSVVRNKVMTREEYRAYEDSWAQLPNASVYDDGHYFDLFRTSDALITDCGSFLAEYLPAGGPILWLVSDRSVGLNPVGEALAEGYYQATNPDELLAHFQQVIVEGDDPLEPIRRGLTERLFPSGGRAAERLVGHLKDTFGLP
jgi:glycosyltransferase involved in cell wall biosynthesis